MSDEIVEEARRVIDSVGGFRADLRAKGIHVGLGNPPVCVVDDEPWPCAHERGNQ